MTVTTYSCTEFQSDAVYPYSLFPEKGTPVYPFRHSGREASPVAARMARALKTALAGTPFEVVEDACLKFADGGHTYQTSLAVRSIGTAEISMDIEIDEPYTAGDSVPRHYIEDSSDSHRDHLFRSNGWIVVRFAEKQTVEELAACCNYIVATINRLKVFPPVGGTGAPARTKPAPLGRLSRVSAERAVRSGLRAGYLAREGIPARDARPYADEAPLTAEENEITRITAAGVSAKYAPDNIAGYNAAHRFGRDADIAFIPDTHTYLYRGRDKLKSVTTVISELFPAFDIQGTAERKARHEQCSPNVFIDKWALASREAAETGTHMHAQIEKYFLGQKGNSTFRLLFNSPTLKCDKYIDVGKELGFFNDFITRANLRPFRTEWPIFDTKARIAGSPDLVAEKNGRLMMFDWKRSTKVVDARASRGINGKPDFKCWNRYGFGTYSPLPDCAFTHYSLQQAVYRRILKMNYGLDIERTFLVVLHPQYSHFYIVETMDVEKYVDHIFECLH